MPEDIKSRYHSILDRINTACKLAGRDPSGITLVAVSKTKPDSDVLELIDAGHLHFGENRAKALEDRMASIEDPNVQWHFIGTLQTNKIKFMAQRVNWIQSVHKKKALEEIEKRAAAENREINVLIQVNISEEDQKSGCDPEELETILNTAQPLAHVKVKGLMGMATLSDNPEIVRPEFRKLRTLRDEHRHMESGSVSLEQLSMGMTNDLEVAIEEGATMVRVGTAIFGERNY
ncbi:MAG: YggS family pyridoxal phosphate-dependent enzyme [Balneolaceae bacterium]|nr:MAG: YggS family pyridoxal phosphate-dependent enzyme [Balneolaceae bacterium]